MCGGERKDWQDGKEANVVRQSEFFFQSVSGPPPTRGKVLLLWPMTRNSRLRSLADEDFRPGPITAGCGSNGRESRHQSGLRLQLGCRTPVEHVSRGQEGDMLEGVWKR